MKIIKSQKTKSRLLGSLVIILSTIPSFMSAQVVGGGGGVQPTYGNSSNINQNEDDLFSYFEFGFILPQGLFAQSVSNPDFNSTYWNFKNPFKGLDGLGAKTGYSIKYSMFASFTKMQLSSTLPARFGLNFGFDFGYIPTSWSNVRNTYITNVTSDPFFYMGFKIGPQFNFNFMDNMGLCIYATIDPYMSLPGGVHGTYSDGSTYDVTDSSSIHVNINTSAGIMFYYKVLVVGLEYNWAHTKYNGQGKYTDNAGNVYYGTDNAFSSVIHTNMMKITIGLRFGTGRRT